MRWIMLAAAILSGLGPVAALTANEVAELSRAGVGDPVIIAQLEADGVRTHLSAETILRLQSEGVSDEVIVAMIRAGSRPAPTTPSLTEQRRALDREKAAARTLPTTFVQTVTPLYSPYGYPYNSPYACAPPPVQFNYIVGHDRPLFVNGSPGVYGAPVTRPYPVRIEPCRPQSSGITIIVRSRDGR